MGGGGGGGEGGGGFWGRNKKIMQGIACVARVAVRSERNSGCAKEFFTFGPRDKKGESKKVEGRRWGEEGRERLPANPSITSFHG